MVSGKNRSQFDLVAFFGVRSWSFAKQGLLALEHLRIVALEEAYRAAVIDISFTTSCYKMWSLAAVQL